MRIYLSYQKVTSPEIMSTITRNTQSIFIVMTNLGINLFQEKIGNVKMK